MCTLTRQQKANIRKRDGKYIKLTGKCSLCGNSAETSRHHLWYDKEKFCQEAIIEVCNKCDCKIHKRNENDNWVRELKAVRAIELIRNRKDPDNYLITVNNKLVGHAHQTINGMKLIITD